MGWPPGEDGPQGAAATVKVYAIACTKTAGENPDQGLTSAALMAGPQSRTWPATKSPNSAMLIFTGVTPTRYLDTRSTGQTLATQGTLNLIVTGGDAVVPTSAKAVVLNITVVAGNGGYLTAFPAGVSAPKASDLNFSAGQVVPNLVVVAVGSSGQIAFFNLAGPTEVIVDVLGWYS